MSSNTTFVAVCRGTSIGDAHLLAVSTDQELVRGVVTRLLDTTHDASEDPVVRALIDGRREAVSAAVDPSAVIR